MANRVARMEFELLLEVEGVQFRCADFSANFSLNDIPKANVTLALGREGFTLDPSSVHLEAGEKVLRSMSKARVIFRPRGLWQPTDNISQGGLWTEQGEQVIFEGYVTGSGYRKQYGVVQYGVSLIHWLADLHFSSCMSETSHPFNPMRFRWRTLFPSMGTEGADGEGVHFISETTGLELYTVDRITTDLWGKCLHPMFCSIANQDILSPSFEDDCGGGPGVSKNDKALAALARIELGKGDEAVGEDCETGATSPYHVPLSFDLEEDQASLIAEAIANWISHAEIETFWNTTVWDKIVGTYGPAFGFALVPKILTAQIVPYIPGLRDTFDKVLDIRDITYLDITIQIPAPLRGVGVLAENIAFGSNPFGDSAPLDILGGCWVPDPDARGLLMFVPPPSWLRSVPAVYNDPKATAVDNTASSTTPQAPGKSVGRKGVTPTMGHNKLGNYYNKEAKRVFADYMLRGRLAVIQGKLRFDIAPGSTVYIHQEDPLWIPNDALSPGLVGEVSRVGVAMSAEASMAGTSFQLEYVRTTDENGDDRTSVAGHPFYKESFRGAPLLDAYMFPGT